MQTSRISMDAGARPQNSDYVFVQASPDSAADGPRIGFKNAVRINLVGGRDTLQMIGRVDVSGPTLLRGGDWEDQLVPGNIPDHGDLVFHGVVSFLTGQAIDFVEFGNSFDGSDRERFTRAVTISTRDQEDAVAAPGGLAIARDMSITPEYQDRVRTGKHPDGRYKSWRKVRCI